jgi:hypothetical protein
MGLADSNPSSRQDAVLRCPECGDELQLGHDCLAVPCQEPERSSLVDGLADQNPRKRLDGWLLPEEAKAISDVLISVWRDAEANDDEATVAKAKAALDFLDLPWVSL